MSRLEISKKTVLLNSASSAGTLLLNLTVLVWLQQYLIKRISPEEYSLLPLVMSIMAFGPLLSIVLTGGIGRYVTTAYTQGRDDEVTAICSTMFPVLTGFSVIIALGGAAFTYFVDHFLKVAPAQLTDVRAMLGISLFTLCLRLVLSIFSAGIIVRQKLVWEDAINIISQLVKFILLFALLLGAGTRVLWVVVATQVSEVAAVVVSTIVSLRLIPAQRLSLGSIRWSLAKELIGYGSWNLVEQTSRTTKQALDPLLLNQYASALDLSTYHVSGIAPRQLSMLLVPITRPFLPVLTAFYAAGDMGRLRRTYLRTARYHLWVLLTVAIPAAFFSHRVMFLYLSGNYPDAGNVMALLIFVPVLGAFNALGAATAMAIGEARGFALRQLGVLMFAIAASVVLVAVLKMGPYGSALAALVSAGVAESILLWPYCRRLTQTTTSEWFKEVVVPTVLPTLPSIGLCFLVTKIHPLESWATIVLASAVSAIVYLALIFTLALRPQDKADMHRLAARMPPRLRPVFAWLGRGVAPENE